MNLKILFILLVYYAVVSIFFTFGNAYFNDYDVDIMLNDTSLQEDETDTGGLFSSGISFSRYFLFITFGIGLPDDTPSWFSFLFILFETVLTIFTIGWVISSIWDG